MKQINKKGVLKNWIKSEWIKFDERQNANKNDSEIKADNLSYGSHGIKITDTYQKLDNKQNDTSVSQVTARNRVQDNLDP